MIKVYFNIYAIFIIKSKLYVILSDLFYIIIFIKIKEYF